MIKLQVSNRRKKFLEFFICVIHRWPRGKALPTLQHLCALADLLDVSADDLLARKSTHKREYMEIDVLNCFRTEEISRRSRTLNAYQQALNLQNRHTV